MADQAFQPGAWQENPWVGIGGGAGAGGIATGEAFGIAKVERQLGATGITTDEAFGETKIQRQVRGDGAGISTGVAFGLPTVGATSTLAISAAGAIPSGAAFGVTYLFIRVGPSGLVSVSAVGQPTLNRVSAVGRVATGEAFGAQRVQRQVREDGTGITSGEAFGTPQIEHQAREAGIPTGEAFGVQRVQRQVRGDGAGIASTQAVGKPAVANRIGCAGIASAAAVGTPRLLRVTLQGLGTGEAFGRPTVTTPPQPVQVSLGGGRHGHFTGPAREPHYILERQRRDQPAVPRPDPAPVSAAGGIVSRAAFGFPAVTLRRPPPPIDYLSREEEELLGILELVA